MILSYTPLVLLFTRPCNVLIQPPVCFTVRINMTEYWKEHSKGATVEEMMLDSRAQELTQNELPEILSMLPCLTGCTVLELGAGIGYDVN